MRRAANVRQNNPFHERDTDRQKMTNPEKFLNDAIEFQSRLTEGARVLSEIGEIEVGMTPKEEIFKSNGVVLYRYHPLVPTNRASNPLLIVYALVNRPYIVDLHERRSLVRGLLNEGHDVYLIDWGYPGPSDRYLDMSYYVDEMIGKCVSETCRSSNSSRVNLLGICQGGTMSLCYAALNPARVSNLITMVTPVDFHTPDNTLANWFRDIDVDLLVDTMGNVPGIMLNSMFLSLKPFKLSVEKYLDFVEIIDQKDKVVNFLQMEKWIFDSPDQAGAMFRTFLKEFFHENRLVTGGLEISGRNVSLKSITMPVLNLMAKQDHLVPPSASKPLKSLVGTSDYTEKTYNTGHIGIYVSNKAGGDIPTRIANWLRERQAD